MFLKFIYSPIPLIMQQNFFSACSFLIIRVIIYIIVLKCE